MSGTDQVSSSSKPPLLVDPAVKGGTIKYNSYNGDGTSIALFVPDDDKAVTNNTHGDDKGVVTPMAR